MVSAMHDAMLWMEYERSKSEKSTEENEGIVQEERRIKSETADFHRTYGGSTACGKPTVPDYNQQETPTKGDSFVIADRFDTNKLRMDLLPVEWTVELSKVLTRGAEKYGDNNWQKGMEWSRCVGSLYRHLTKWQSGITFDSETQCHHLAHVAWNALALLTYQLEGVGVDDRKISRYKEEDWLIKSIKDSPTTTDTVNNNNCEGNDKDEHFYY